MNLPNHRSPLIDPGGFERTADQSWLFTFEDGSYIDLRDGGEIHAFSSVECAFVSTFDTVEGAMRWLFRD